MIIRPNCVPLTDKLREIIQNGDSGFPFVAMEADLTLYAGRCAPWHWHDYFEFVVVQAGEVELNLERGSFHLRTGDGFFLNANVLHQLRIAGGADAGVVHAQQLGRELIAGTERVARRYVNPVEKCPSLDVFILRRDQVEHAALLLELRQSFHAAAGDADGHELQICASLNSAWHALYALVQNRLSATTCITRENSRRLKAMLSLIHSRYAGPLSVKDIADAAGICERECFRSFRELLMVTPTEYLNRHRTAAAMRLLLETELSIAEIAEACGFSDAGYFCKVFKSHAGCTPSVYRKRAAQA